MTVQTTQTARVSPKFMGESERRITGNAYFPLIDPAAEIARRIRTLRETTGLSRPKFAVIMGNMPSATLKNYELHYRETSLQLIQYIAAVFGSAVLTWVVTGLGGISEEDVKRSVAKFEVDHVVG